MPPRRKVAPVKLTPPVSTEDTENDSSFTFEEEIEWCVKKLQQTLVLKYRDHKDLKAAKPIVIALKTLENRNNPVPKIRKMMRAGCGDYRKEMKEEFEKAKAESQKLAVDSEDQVKGIKVSTVNSKKSEENTGNKISETEPFCFNFPHPNVASTSG